MNNFLRMCLNIITQIGPYLVVLLLLKYLVNLQQKRAKEREEEQKKGIIRTHYIIKTEKVLTMFFVLAVFLFGGATVASAIQQDDLLPPIGFSIFFIVSLIGSLNMIMWKLEVNGDEITWRSTFGRKRTFHFDSPVLLGPQRSRTTPSCIRSGALEGKFCPGHPNIGPQPRSHPGAACQRNRSHRPLFCRPPD